MSQPLFSIVVPTCNRPAMLRVAVESVLQQTIEDFECLVVDDASDTPADLPQDRRVHVIRHDERRGPAVARNTALAAATGRYVAFLDDDDTYVPERLAYGLEGLSRAPLALCWRTPDKGGGRTLEGDVRDVILDDIPPHLGQVSVRRESALRFNPSFLAMQDVEWWLRMAHTTTVTTVPKVGYVLNQHDGHRGLNGKPARVTSGLLLMNVHADYFATHRRAYAHRLLRVGLTAGAVGDVDTARLLLARSFRARPSLRTAAHLAHQLFTTPRRGSLAARQDAE